MRPLSIEFDVGIRVMGPLGWLICGLAGANILLAIAGISLWARGDHKPASADVAQQAAVSAAPDGPFDAAAMQQREDEARLRKVAGFPWDSALTSLEKVQMPGVKVLSLEGSAIEGSINVEVEAPSQQSALAYIVQLQALQPGWRMVQIRGEVAGGARATIVFHHK